MKRQGPLYDTHNTLGCDVEHVFLHYKERTTLNTDIQAVGYRHEAENVV